MSCQGPDGLKVICKLPDLVNVFTLLGQSVKDIEKSGVLKTRANKEAFHVLFKLSRKIAKKLNDLSVALNQYRDVLVQLIKEKAKDRERPMLLQKVTTVLQDLRQEMGKLAPKLSQVKKGARDVGNRQAMQNTLNLYINKEAALEDTARAESGVATLTGTDVDTAGYRGVIPTPEDLLRPATGLDATTGALSDIRGLFKYFHEIARVDSSLMKLEQDIGDFLTEILLLFQEEIVELKMLIRLCQSSISSSEKDKDKKMANALNHVRKFMGQDEDDDDEDEEIPIIETDCTPTVRTWREITNGLFEAGKIIE